MSIELNRHALNGPTMGTRWSALVHAPTSTDPDRLRAALAQAVDEIDCQMSTWKPDSDLMRMNAAPPGLWVDLPPALMQVLAKGLEIGRASNGAFDSGLGDLTNAWGFGPQAADTGAIRAHLGQGRPPAHDVLELDAVRCRARTHGNLQLDLSGLAKNLRQRPDGRWVWHWDPKFIVGAGGSTDETRSSVVDPDRLEQAVDGLRIPALLVRGRSSDLLSEEGARDFMERVAHAEFADVAGAGHMVAGDRNEIFNQAILGFLERHRAGA